ncbi:MAG TPA: hypothetical protein VK428_10180 [Acidimicrobiales bacterium]|nr:hypothetical protein [Acidimicrobiales bacterium]
MVSKAARSDAVPMSVGIAGVVDRLEGAGSEEQPQRITAPPKSAARESTTRPVTGPANPISGRIDAVGGPNSLFCSLA